MASPHHQSMTPTSKKKVNQDINSNKKSNNNNNDSFAQKEENGGTNDDIDIDNNKTINIQKNVNEQQNVEISSGNDSSNNANSDSSDDDVEETESSFLRNLPSEEDFLNSSIIPNEKSFQALPLLYRSSEFIKNTDVDNLNIKNEEDEDESYKSLLEYKRKYKKAISDLQFSKLEFQQNLIENKGTYTDEIRKLKEEMSDLKVKHEYEIKKMQKEINDLNIRLSRKVDVAVIEQLERDVEVSKHQIETLQTQLRTAHQMKEYLHSQWIEQQEIVENVKNAIKHNIDIKL
jgi:hypothetical protein